MAELAEDQLATYMRKAVELSADHVDAGGIPFSALVVHPLRGIIGTGVNQVAEDHDPTAHAEVVALRDACARVGRFSLHGCVLIASGEPCAMCYLVTLYSGVERVRYAVDRHEAARAGFNYANSYDLFAQPPEQWPLDTSALPVENGFEPFRRWIAGRLR